MIIFSFLVFSPIYAQNDVIVIPHWIKIDMKWWANEKISDEEFLLMLQLLIEKKLIILSNTEKILVDNHKTIPPWIKNIAKYWTDEKTSDKEFLDLLIF